ncbi:5045_t:CDS:1, partial [Funneliformis geosporum]
QRQENQTKITGVTSDSPLSLETIQNEQPRKRQTLQTEEKLKMNS